MGSPEPAQDGPDALVVEVPALASMPDNWSYAFDGTFDPSPPPHGARSTSTDPSGRITMASSYQREPGADMDALVVRTSAAGHLEWARRYGMTGADEHAWGSTPAAGGGSMVVGSADGQPMRFRVDSSGVLSWAYSEINIGAGEATVVTRLGSDYVMSGAVKAGGTTVPFATRFAEDGTLAWSKRFEDLLGLPVEHSVSDVFDRGTDLLLVGVRRDLAPVPSNTTQSLFIMTVDAITGTIVEMRVYPHADPTVEWALAAPSLVQTDLGYAIGYSVRLEGEVRAAVALLDASLDPVHELQYSAPQEAFGATQSRGLSLVRTTSGDLDLGVAYDRRPGLLSLDAAGGVIASWTYGMEGATPRHVEAMVLGAGGYVLSDYDVERLDVAVVQLDGAGICQLEHGVEAYEAELSVEMVAYPTGAPTFPSLTYPLPFVDQPAYRRSGCQ